MRSLRELWGDVDPYHGVAPNDGNLQGFHLECPILKEVIEKTGAKRILETGAHQGGSAIWMAECSGGEVLTCDPWALDARIFSNPRRRQRYGQAYDVFRQTVVARKLQGRVIYLPMVSDEAFKVCDEHGLSFDMAYIDGGHDYAQCSADIAAAKRLTRGPIVVDDYEAGRFDGVVKAVMEHAPDADIRGRKAIIWRASHGDTDNRRAA